MRMSRGDYERVLTNLRSGSKAALSELALRECRSLSGTIRWLVERGLREEGITIERPANRDGASAGNAVEVTR